MSAFSSSSPENDRIRSRLALMAQNGKWGIFHGWPQGDKELEAICIISKVNPGSADGFQLLLVKPHRVPERLGEVFLRLVTRFRLPAALTSLCRPDSQIGSRICHTQVRGSSEYYYARVGSTAHAAKESHGRSADLLCSVGGLGYVPVIGATAASLVTSLFALSVSTNLSSGVWRMTLLALALASTGACVALERWAHLQYLTEDPREVVLDEVAGMSLTMALVGSDPILILSGFLAFRFFDIVKPGTHWVEKRRWRGTIVWDDLLAGLYAAVSVLATQAILRS